jgi:hypothetical protein
VKASNAIEIAMNTAPNPSAARALRRRAREFV